jgi:excisionase family DNA binding protein
MNKSERLLVTVTEAASLLGISRSFIYVLLTKGYIKSIHVGRARRIPQTALEEFVNSRMDEQQEDLTQHPGGKQIRKENRKSPK